MFAIELLYLVSVGLLAVYGTNSLVHTWIYWRRAGKIDGTAEHPLPAAARPAHDDGPPQLPAVTVQLPIFNERHVAGRLLRAVAALEWPRERLQIQVLDDSTDDTTAIIAALIADYEGSGLDIQHLHRHDRSGYKAGALQLGMASASGDLIAIFDADFVPPSDFCSARSPVSMTQKSAVCRPAGATSTQTLLT
ncbi:MAG: glycosyltransferase [Caldilineaceae bacterium]|nr:glycosyltransferase [Caldilineaceae bacterium]